MKTTLTLFFALVIMMTRANAQTCEIGYSDLDITIGSSSTNTSVNSWNSPTTNQIFGTQRVVNKNGNITAIGFACGNATTIQVGLYSDNSNVPDDLLWNSSAFDPSASIFVDTFYRVLSSPIPVSAGDKFWPFIRCQTASMYSILANNDTDTGFLKFKQSAGATWPTLQNPIIVTSGQPDVGQWAIWLVIEDCVEPIIQTIADGNANDPNTWLLGNLPANGDSVLVQHEVNWNLDHIGSSITLASLTVTDPLTMLPGSSIQTQALVDSLGNNFAERVRLTRPSGSVSVAGSSTDTTYFEKLIIDADAVSFGIATEVFNLELARSTTVHPSNLTMQGKLNIPSSIFWDSLVAPTFSDSVKINERFSILNPPGSAQGTWRIHGNPGTGITMGDWDLYHTTSGYPGSDFPNSNWQSPSIYKEANPSTDKNVGWMAPSGDSHLLDSLAFFAYHLAGEYATTFHVNMQTGDRTYNPSFTSSGNAQADGWSLIENPFACSIDMREIMTVNCHPTIYTYDNLNTVLGNAAPQYDAYNLPTGTGTNDRDERLAAGQGFWIKASGPNASVTIPASAMIDTDDVEYRSGGGDGGGMPAIEIIIYGITEGAETVEELPSANTFIVPMENGNLAFDSFDAPTMNTPGTNMTINTFSSDGVSLDYNFVPRDQTIIVSVYASTITPSSPEHLFRINIPEEFSDWCISYDQVGWGSEGENWFIAEDGELFGLLFMDPINQNSQRHILDIRLQPSSGPTTVALGASNTTILWEPNQESVSVNVIAEGNWESISWDTSDGTFEESADEITAVFTEPGNYTVYAEVLGSCDASATASIDINVLCVDMSFEMLNTFIQDTLPTNGSTNIVVLPYLHDGVEGVSWDINGWVFESVPDSAESINVGLTEPGAYTCSATAFNACGEQITVFFTIMVYLPDEDTSVEGIEASTFTLFPNPSNGNSITITYSHSEPATLSIVDAIGKVVQRDVVSANGTKEIYFTQRLAPGMYYVRMESLGAVYTKPFVVK